jgi:hypothetical protein
MYCPVVVRSFLAIQLDSTPEIKSLDDKLVIVFVYKDLEYEILFIQDESCVEVKYKDIEINRMPVSCSQYVPDLDLMKKFITYAMGRQ